MKRLLLSGICLLVCTLNLFAQEYDKSAQLKSLIQSANIPGIQLMYSKDGHEVSYNIGTISSGSAVPVTVASIFEAASLSKAVFAYTVLRLVDKGVIALDTPLQHYTGGSYERFDPGNQAYEKITARLVLCHRTGFRNWADSGRIPLLFPPDSCFNYSGEAYMFLLAVLEKVTHKDLEQLAKQETFTPLGMNNSSFLWDPKFAAVSTFGNDSDAIKNHSELNAASSLLTNAQDYSIFLDALITGKGLKPETYHLMLSQQTPGNWFNHPVIPATAHIGWGLGVGIQHNEKGTAIWQWGDNGEFKAFYIAFPATGEHLVYFTHSSRGLYIAQDVVDLLLGKQTTWAVQWVKNGYSTPYDIGYADPYAVKAFREQHKPAAAVPEQDLRTLAGILKETGKFKNALEVLKQNAAAYPKNADALEGLAEGYLDTNNTLLAITYAKKSLAIDPANEKALALLTELTNK